MTAPDERTALSASQPAAAEAVPGPGPGNKPPPIPASSKRVTPRPKPVRRRNKAHLAFVAAQPCLVCQRTPCDAHHLKFAQAKALGRKGDFYRIAGDKARAIDGPTSGTIPPYNKAVVLGPERPREVAQHVKSLLGGVPEVAVVDINDLGGNILGSTLDKEGEKRLVTILRDNPLGQGHQSTPLGVVRAV